MRIGTIALFALSLILSAPAHAAGHSGRTAEVDRLVGFCRAFDDGSATPSRRNAGRARAPAAPADTMLCLGYMLAMQGLVVLEDENGQRVFDACPPEDTTVAQLVRAFLTYARKHPGVSGETAATTVLKSLQDAFPCRSAAASGTMETTAMR